MNINFKKIILSLAFVAILITSTTVQAANLIEDVKVRDKIATGVTHVKIDRFTTDGWIDIDVLKLDPKNQFSDLTPLIGEDGVSKRAKLSAMLDSNDKAVAGINGDFFEHSKYPMALGSLYGDGELILTTPEKAFSRNSFYLTKDGIGGVGSLNNDISINNIRSGQTYSINALNKVSKPYSSISILDSNWGKTSPGNSIGSNNVEVLVANGIVVDKRIGGSPMKIEKGYYVLTQVGETLKDVNVGDALQINFGSYNNLKFAIGGGNVLVKDGEIMDSPKLSKTRAPRTAIGINKNNSEILLVTVDGRNNKSIGMTELELAEFMRSIGAYQALNLDGGGSTTMGIKYSRDEKTTVVNSPSDGNERPIVSGVGIKSEAPIKEPSYIKVSIDTEDPFIGFSYNLKGEVFDEYHHKLDVPVENITFNSESGNISGLSFSPTNKGHGKIYASYGNAKGETDIYVHSEIKELILDVDSLQIKNGGVHIFETIYGKDDMGYKKKIHSSNVAFSMSEGLGNLEGNKFTASEEAVTGTITANYNGIIRSIPVSVGTEKKDIFDFSNIEDTTVNTTPSDDTKLTAKVFLDDDNVDENKSTGLIYSIGDHEESSSISLIYNNGINLGRAKYIGLWVKGDNSQGNLKVQFKDSSGKVQGTDLITNIDFEDWKYVEAAVPNNLNGDIKLEKLILKVNDKKDLVSSIKFDGLVAGISLPLNWELVGDSSEIIDNSNYYMENENTKRFSITSLSKSGKDNSSKLNHLNGKNVSVILNGASEEILNNINSSSKFNGNDVHNIKQAHGTAFITLQSNQYGLRSANPNQWKPFINAMRNEDYKNIIILMQKDPDNINGNKEKTYFFNLIDDAIKSGKNVFIVIPSYRDSVELVNGYRKVTLAENGDGILDIQILNNNLAYLISRVD